MQDYAEGKNATPLPPGLTNFDWETKITDIVPKELGWSLQDLNGDDWASRDASIADVLGHASGLPRHDFSYRPGDAPEDVVRRMGSLRTAYELRKKWSYNNQVRTPPCVVRLSHLITRVLHMNGSSSFLERILSLTMPTCPIRTLSHSASSNLLE